MKYDEPGMTIFIHSAYKQEEHGFKNLTYYQAIRDEENCGQNKRALNLRCRVTPEQTLQRIFCELIVDGLQSGELIP